MYITGFFLDSAALIHTEQHMEGCAVVPGHHNGASVIHTADRPVNANLKMSIFAETKCHFSAVGMVVYTALFHNFACRNEACQALIYQLVLGLAGENGKYNYSKAVLVYPPFSDITCSAKNYKIALALTMERMAKAYLERQKKKGGK